MTIEQNKNNTVLNIWAGWPACKGQVHRARAVCHAKAGRRIALVFAVLAVLVCASIVEVQTAAAEPGIEKIESTSLFEDLPIAFEEAFSEIPESQKHLGFDANLARRFEDGARGYVLATGDELLVSVRGEVSFSKTYIISDEGYLISSESETNTGYNEEFPPVWLEGIQAAGKSIPQLRNELREFLEGELIVDFDLYVSLHQPRLIEVFILGQVEIAGSYRLPAGYRAIEAIRSAGGMKTSASYRSVELRRDNGEPVTEYLDFYRFFVDAQIDQNPMLENGDVIFVPVVSKRVSLIGFVNNIGVYELKRNEGLPELIEYSGGFEAGAQLDAVKIERITPGGIKELIEINMADAFAAVENGSALKNGDIVHVPQISKFIYVLGEVIEPGAMKFRPGYTLSDYVIMAGGPGPNAKLNIVTILRETTGGGQKFVVDYRHYLNTGVWNQEVPLMPGDTIVVPSDSSIKMNQVISYFTSLIPIFTFLEVK